MEGVSEAALDSWLLQAPALTTASSVLLNLGKQEQ